MTCVQCGRTIATPTPDPFRCAICRERKSLDTVEGLRLRLNLIIRAALNHIDGDSQPHDTHWSEIIGIAEADPNWLQHAKANYDVQHARLVELSKGLLNTIIDQLSFTADEMVIARMMADQIEQALLPEMMLAEDGRTFRRAQEVKP